MNWDVLMPFFKPVVLLDIMQKVASNDNCSLHLGREHDTLEDSTSDAHVAGPWAFLVNILTIDSFCGSFEAEADLLEVSHTL